MKHLGLSGGTGAKEPDKPDSPTVEELVEFAIRRFDELSFPNEIDATLFADGLVRALGSSDRSLRAQSLHVFASATREWAWWIADIYGEGNSLWLEAMVERFPYNRLRECLSDESPLVQQGAAEAVWELARLAHKEGQLPKGLDKSDLVSAVPALEQVVDSGSADAAALGLRALSYLTFPETKSRLTAGLQNPSAVVRQAALEELARRGAMDGDVLVELVDDIEADVRQSAATALGKLDHEVRAVTALVRRLEDEAPTVRKACIHALRAMDAVEAVEAMARRLDDESEVALAAIEALVQRATPDLGPSLTKALENKSLRIHAARALTYSPHPPSVPRLLGLLDEELNAGEIRAVVKALGSAGDNRAEDALWRLYRKTRKAVDHDLKRLLLMSLGKCKSQKAAQEALTLLDRDDWRDKRVLTNVIGLAGTEEHLSVLQELLKEEATRCHAAMAMAHISPELLGEPPVLDLVLQPLRLAITQSYDIKYGYWPPAACLLAVSAKARNLQALSGISPLVRETLCRARDRVMAMHIDDSDSFREERQGDRRRFLALAERCLDAWAL